MPVAAQPGRVSVQQITPAARPATEPLQVPRGTTARSNPAEACAVDTASDTSARQSCLAAQAQAEERRSGEGTLLELLGREATVTSTTEGTTRQVINADAVARQLAGSDFQDATPDGAAAAVARGQAAPPPTGPR